MKAKRLLMKALLTLNLVCCVVLLGTSVIEAAPPQQGGVAYHTVQRGENLARIAARYGSTISAIMQRNNIQNPNIIYAGQRLAISGSSTSTAKPSITSPPVRTSSCAAGCTYRIAWGDTLSRIAARHSTTVQCLMSANGLGSSYIMAGSTLHVPCAGSGVSSPPSPSGSTVVPQSVNKRVATRASYRIRSGDTLSSIALLYRTTVQAIMAANGLTNPHHIYAGQVLQIPLR